MKQLCSYLLIVTTIFMPNTLVPCTGIFLKTETNNYIYARTMEFGYDLTSEILFVPRNYAFKAAAPSGERDGFAWQSHYAVVGANAFGIEGFIDGVNEQGLAGGLFYFPGFAQYQEVAKQDYHKSVPVWQLLTLLLTTCSTIEDVKQKLNTILVSNTPFAQMNGTVPAHLIMHDTKGNSVVIEYREGRAYIYDNPLGVITNAPSFDWHLTNVRNYINLSPKNVADKTMSGIVFSQLGQGSGMLGLPGDFTPPSRFIRAVAFTQAAPKAKTDLECVYQAFHLLNNFDIPRNLVIDKSGAFEYTQWTSVCDMKNKIFYFRPYDNCQLAKIDLTKMPIQGKKSQRFSMKYIDTIVDITQVTQKQKYRKV